MEITSFHIFLIIIFSLIFIFIIVISIICFIKKLNLKKNKKEIEFRPNSITSAVQSSQSTEVGTALPFQISQENGKEKKNKEYLTKEVKINAFCNCFLKPVKYSMIKVYNDSCPIDLIPFNGNDDVSVTKCSHAFHFNCIKKYLLENGSNNEFKCPICLAVIFEMNIKI